MTKKLLFSVSIKDCLVEAFRGSGAGGQKRNKTSSGIRVVHSQSGAVGKSTEAREQHINKRTAFLRMIETKEFKTWHRIQTAKLCGQKTPEELVEEEMQSKNLKFEIMKDGKFVKVDEIVSDEKI